MTPRSSFLAGVGLAIGLAGCVAPEPDTGEGGGLILWSPDRSEGLVCGEEECPIDECRQNVRCSDDGQECVWEQIDGWDDHDPCTVDLCDPDTGAITHVPEDVICGTS